MLPIILKAAENFCMHQIGLPHTTVDSNEKKRTLIAYLDIKTKDGEKHRAYLGCDKLLIQHIAEIYLGEESSDEETLMDMLLETTNMIIGSAKVISEASDIDAFTISTPHFLKEDSFSMPYDAIHTIKIANGEMMIAIKAI